MDEGQRLYAEEAGADLLWETMEGLSSAAGRPRLRVVLFTMYGSQPSGVAMAGEDQVSAISLCNQQDFVSQLSAITLPA